MKQPLSYMLGGILLGILLPACQSSEESSYENELKIARQAAEFEEQEAVWMIWPPEDHLAGYSNDAVALQIAQSVSAHQKVHVCANSAELLEHAKSLIADSLEGNIEFHEVPSVEFWTRDMGPNFVEGVNGEKMMADYGFNAWGYSDTTDADAKVEEKFDERIADLMGLPMISTDLISEGGDREVNGKGTLMVVEEVEMGRNPNMTKEEVEAELKRMTGASHVVWLKEGLKEDEHTFLGPIDMGEEKAFTVLTTNGHIDEFARFVNENTVLLASVAEEDMEDPIARINHERMEENYQILKEAVDQDGNPFNIVRMPLPRTIEGEMKPGDPVYDVISTLEYAQGDVFPVGEPVKVLAAASYLNFLITNEVVLGQKYWKEGMDEIMKERDAEAQRILTEIFPEREVLMLDALSVNFGGGGIHCITMQEPK
ncbi:MAG: agmatine deiminase family protein [Bacteroidota bacterium]